MQLLKLWQCIYPYTHGDWHTHSILDSLQPKPANVCVIKCMIDISDYIRTLLYCEWEAREWRERGEIEEGLNFIVCHRVHPTFSLP